MGELARALGATAAAVAVLEPRNPLEAEGGAVVWDAQGARAGLQRTDPLE